VCVRRKRTRVRSSGETHTRLAYRTRSDERAGRGDPARRSDDGPADRPTRSVDGRAGRRRVCSALYLHREPAALDRLCGGDPRAVPRRGGRRSDAGLSGTKVEHLCEAAAGNVTMSGLSYLPEYETSISCYDMELLLAY